MATRQTPTIPLVEGADSAAMQRPHWRTRARLSSIGDKIEQFLTDSGFDRGPWMAVAFASGILLWFWLGGPAQWVTALSLLAVVALGAVAAWKGAEHRSHLLLACMALAILVGAGMATIWARSEMVGAPALDYPVSAQFNGRILERIEQPSQGRVRLVLATRHPDTAEAIKVRVNLALEKDQSGLIEGAVIRLRARLMPPAPPMLPGSYDFARAAWFKGYAATGSVQGEVEILEAGRPADSLIAPLQRRLAAHVRSQIAGSPGTIAATFASGDRGAISDADQEAMRDAGLTHLLAISGLHVSAVIAAAYLLAIKLMALWPWLALRVRLPIVAAGLAALAGISYTLLTGAQVPTVRSCVGAVLVLIALALGREPLSLRMVAMAAMFVLLAWPESIAGPSFQMSFSAVIVIVALHSAAPIKAFFARREENWFKKIGRGAAMLLLTGLAIEIALMPIVMFHFHRAGIYGAFANVLAIPLVTFISMPLISIALFFDIIGLGAPFWWLAGKSLEVLLGLAHFTSSQPGAVRLMPQMGYGTLGLFVIGGLWLGLWKGKARTLGLIPAGAATLLLLATPIPDLLVSGDGRHVGITGESVGDQGAQLLVLRDTKSAFTLDNLLELSGVEGKTVPLDEWPGAQCSPDSCVITLNRGDRDWHILMIRSNDLIPEAALAEACKQSDIVVADRWLPRSCQPKWLKADRSTLSETGGLAISLEDAEFTAVADNQGQHGWWPALK